MHPFRFFILAAALLPGSYAGFNSNPTALLQNVGNPCDCKGGTSNTVLQRTHIATADCGDKTAYLPLQGIPGLPRGYICVPKPRVSDPHSKNHSCPCSTFQESMHSSCYSSYFQCTSGGQSYYATQLQSTRRSSSPDHLPQVVHSSPYLSAPCVGTPGQWACWRTTAPVHISDGGGPQDQLRHQQLTKRWKTLFSPSPLLYHPLVRPRPHSVALDPQTQDILEATHRALNLTAPSLAQDCWLCLALGTPYPLAIPVLNSSLLNLTTDNCSATPPFPVQVSSPLNASCITTNLNSTDAVPVGISLSLCNYEVLTVSPSQRCAPPGHVLVCGSHAYSALPFNWTGICALAIILPDIEIIPGDQPIPIPALDTWPVRTKRAVHMVPLLVGLGIATAVGTGTAGLGVSLDKYTKLAQQMISDMEAVGQSLQEIQDQIDSLAEVVLQNRRGLDLLTVEKGGICLALQERCCFYTNKSGVVRDRVKKLQESLEKRRKELYENPLWSAWNGFLPYLLPLLGPLISLFLLLSIGPCVLRWVSSFINNKLESVRHQFRAAAYAALHHRDPDAYAMLARMTYDRVHTSD